MKTLKTVISLMLMLASISIHAGGLVLVSPEGGTGMIAPGFNPYTLEIRKLHIATTATDRTAQTTITQTFYNPTRMRLQGYFLFPVPKGSILGDFTMTVNGQKLQAELLDAEKARKIYEDIVRKSLDPALLEFAEMDLYKVRIFPFEPMAEKQITISYSQLMEYAGTALELNIPLTVRKYETKTIDDFEISINVSNKNGLKTLYSPDLQVISVHTDEFNGTSKFSAKTFKPVSDFRFYIGTSDQPLGLDLITYKTETSGYFFMNISPGFVPENAKHVPKNVSFVLDVSGSMSGQKIEQARNALKFCVENLNEADFFDIIRFSTEAKALFESKQPANKANKAKALAFIESINAIGGTNMSDAFKLCFPASEKSTRPHSVIFITDGKPTIGELDENLLLKQIEALNTEKARIFTFGIGNEINTKLLDAITDQSRAYRVYISPTEDIGLKISDFFTKINSPVLTGISIKINSATGTEEIYPKNLPDLFKGGNVSVFGKYATNGKHAITLSGTVNEKAVSYNYTGNFTDNSKNEFIAKLWASRKIAYLLENIRLKGENEELKNEVIVLAKKYGIITPYTAYLILEDEAINVSAGNVRQDNAIFNSRFGNRENMLKKQMQEEYEIMEKDKSSRGVRSSEEIQNLGTAQNVNDSKQGNSRMIYTDQLGKERNFSDQSTFVAGRAIYQSGDSWVDSKVMQENTTKYKRIKFAESEYFELLNKNPEMAKFMALGKNVRFIYNNIAYEVHE